MSWQFEWVAENRWFAFRLLGFLLHVRTQVHSHRRIASGIVLSYPSIAWAHGGEIFIIAAAVLGGLIGVAAGALSAWRGWHPVKSFLAALVVFVLVAIAPDVAQAPYDSVWLMTSLGVAVVVVIGLLPVGAGYVFGRWLVPLRFRRGVKSNNAAHA